MFESRDSVANTLGCKLANFYYTFFSANILDGFSHEIAQATKSHNDVLIVGFFDVIQQHINILVTYMG